MNYVMLPLMALALWVFVSLGVRVLLPDAVRQDTWHMRLMRYSRRADYRPESNCSYFFALLLTPLLTLLMWVMRVVILGISLFSRLIYDWLLMPFIGKYAAGATTRSYWTRLIGADAAWEHKENIRSIPGKRFVIAAIVTAAILLWAYIGYSYV